MYLVTLGRDVRGAAAIAAKVNEVIRLVANDEATFTDPEIAGQRLGALLDAGPKRLLVVDDVWERESAGQVRLPSTRRRGYSRPSTVQISQSCDR